MAQHTLHEDLCVTLWMSNGSGKLERVSRSQENEIMRTVASQALANARQGGVDLQVKVIPLLSPHTNPLAPLGALGPHKGVWCWVLLSLFPACTAPSRYSSRISFPGCWWKLFDGGKPAQKGSTQAKFAWFPLGLIDSGSVSSWACS